MPLQYVWQWQTILSSQYTRKEVCSKGVRLCWNKSAFHLKFVGTHISVCFQSQRVSLMVRRTRGFWCSYSHEDLAGTWRGTLCPAVPTSTLMEAYGGTVVAACSRCCNHLRRILSPFSEPFQHSVCLWPFLASTTANNMLDEISQVRYIIASLKWLLHLAVLFFESCSVICTLSCRFDLNGLSKRGHTWLKPLNLFVSLWNLV